MKPRTRFLIVLAGLSTVLPSAFATDYCARPETPNPDPLVALVDTARVGDLSGMKALLAANPNLGVNAQDPEYGESLLTLAVGCVRGETIDFLLESGANPNLQSKSGSTVGEKALILIDETARTFPVLDLLFAHGFDPNRAKYFASNLIGKHNVDLLNYAFAHGLVLESSYGGQSPLEFTLGAFWKPSPVVDELIEILVRHGADPKFVNADGENLATRAVNAGNVPGLKNFVARGISPREDGFGGFQNLNRVVTNGFSDREGPLTEILLAAGAKVELTGTLLQKWETAHPSESASALIAAVKRKFYPLVAPILRAGANPNFIATENYGSTVIRRQALCVLRSVPERSRRPEWAAAEKALLDAGATCSLPANED